MIAAAVAAQQYPPAGGPGDGPAQAQGPADPQQQPPPDEPGRAVARISVLNGDGSVTRGDAGTPVAAVVNAPLMAGDSLSVAPGATAELQLDFGDFARLAGDSQIRISSLDNGKFQIQLGKGLLTYRVLRQTNAQSEIDTPLVAVHPAGMSAVRVEVAPDGSTRVTVRHGDVDIYTPHGTERIHEGNMMMVRGTQEDPEFQVVSAMAPDEWDTWNDQRDNYLMRAQSPRYVSQDVVGTEDLDNYGRWNYDPAYGNVWQPNVPANWAPYQNGNWAWEDYYGWTWVDYSPWGWAPFHYGNWYFRTGFGWNWFPGSRFGHYWYRPALVGFFGFGAGGFGFGTVGWVPLAPFEVYHPWYGRGWGGGFGVNIVHNVNIASTYRNARFSNGVTAVSAADFQRGNFRNRIGVDRAQLSRASLVRGALPVTPSASNLAFRSGAFSNAGPRGDINNQRFYSRMTPSVAAAQRTPFTQQQASARSTFEGRGTAVGAARAGALNDAGIRNSGGATGGAAGWQRFGGSAAGNGYGNQTRSLQVSPPMVRQRDAAPSYGGGAQGFRGAPAPQYRQSAPAPQYRQSAPAPQYRQSAPAPQYRQSAPAPSYRSAPAPSYRSAPAPSAPRGGGGGGGGHASGGGGHGGGRR
jgi:hypothetical protein